MISTGLERLRAELTSLKIGAKPKGWRESPRGYVRAFGYYFTCCIENGRYVLGVSLDPAVNSLDRLSTSDLLDAVIGVFGEPQRTFEATYPNRGATTLFQWDALPG